MTEPQPNGRLSPADVTALVDLMAGMLDRMEARIIGRLDDNSRLASERWVKHDTELVANTKRVVDRFVLIETALDADIAVLEAHLAHERDEQLIHEARVKPVRMSIGYAEKHWRTIALWAVMILTLLGVTVGRLHDLGIIP